MNNTIINYTFLSIAILTGVYLCILGGYGSDEDTLPMIGTFTNLLNGHFMSSRFTGYPVAEFIIGFFSYFFGSAVINLIIFSSFILGSIIFFITAEKNYKKKIILFLLLLISSPILFFDNLEPVDYSLGFLFFSLGYYFLKKQRLELALIFFGVCIGTRINFAPFVIIIIFFNSSNYQGESLRKYFIIISALFIGSLFYLPVWIHSGLSFDWLRAGRPEGGVYEYGARFIYKSFITIGIPQLLIILYLIIKNKINKNFSNNYKFIYYLIIINLIIFFYIPAELSYLQPFLIFLYFFVIKNFSINFVYLLIFFNIFSWFIKFDPIKVIYKELDVCAPIVAINVEFKPSFKQGYLFDYLNSRSKILCWIDPNSNQGKKILDGSPLR